MQNEGIKKIHIEHKYSFTTKEADKQNSDYALILWLVAHSDMLMAGIDCATKLIKAFLNIFIIDII